MSVMTNDMRNSGPTHRNPRSDARELALRMLYQFEIGRQPKEEILSDALAQSNMDHANKAFATKLYNGVISNLVAIDLALGPYTKEWTLNRQSAVDRNILRLAAYELMLAPKSKAPIICNEAVELAKKYSAQESGSFINGALGALIRDRNKSTSIEPAAN